MLNLFFEIFHTGDRYVVETDGLLIRGVTPEDAGHYTCRARVLETGSLEERNIKLEVWCLTFFSQGHGRKPSSQYKPSFQVILKLRR